MPGKKECDPLANQKPLFQVPHQPKNLLSSPTFPPPTPSHTQPPTPTPLQPPQNLQKPLSPLRPHPPSPLQNIPRPNPLPIPPPNNVIPRPKNRRIKLHTNPDSPPLDKNINALHTTPPAAPGAPDRHGPFTPDEQLCLREGADLVGCFENVDVFAYFETEHCACAKGGYEEGEGGGPGFLVVGGVGVVGKEEACA